MDMIARAVGFVVVAVAAEVEEIEFIDETFLFEKVNRAVNGDEVNFGIDFLGAGEDLVHVEMLLGGIHDLQDDAALAGETNMALAKGGLEVASGSSGVDAFSTRDAMSWSSGHGTVVLRSKFNMGGGGDR